MKQSQVRQDILRALDKAVLAADPRSIINEKIELKKGTIIVDKLRMDLTNYDRVFVIGGGKASISMAAAVEKLLGRRITDGLVNYPDYLKPPRLSRIKLNPASHPIPNQRGVSGVEQMLKIGGSLTEKDLFICLVSGGGSSLMPLPMKGMTLADKQEITSLLLKSGADIHEINTVRKHISGVKGGRLAERLFPATILTLIISDVVGHELDSIASGPTVPDSSTNEDAMMILRQRRIWNELSLRVRRVIQHNKDETPKPGSKIFRRVHNILIGSNRQSCVAACREMERLGYKTLILSTSMQGEARQVGTLFSSIVSEIRKNGLPIAPPSAIIAGGESTVTVTGKGLGGRNQELALAASLGIRGLKGVAIASMGTDGIDGPTEAAGGIVDGSTLQRGERRQLDPKIYLQNNDSYHYLEKTNDLIIRGPTGTNVNDIMIGAVI